jgi:hypothetical protein
MISLFFLIKHNHLYNFCLYFLIAQQKITNLYILLKIKPEH